VIAVDESCGTGFFKSIVAESAEVETISSAPSPLYFIMVNGGIPGAMLQLAASGSRIGRSIDNNIQLPDESVSRYHAFVGHDDEDRIRLTDLGSTNGTYINGRRLPPRTPACLRDGDRIQLGSKLVVKFVRPDPSEEKFQREMFERTVRDTLTGLYNRSYFLGEVGSLGDRGALRGLGMAILMIDIDHFKRINDQHGHEIGDKTLCDVAAVLRHSLRGDDLIARYGGEEFVAALPVAAPDAAAERAERIRSALADRQFLVSGTPLEVTVSVGVAYAPAARQRSVPSLIATADRGLYQAKNAGRNRVVFGSEIRAQVVVPSTIADEEFDSTPFE
jgi:two-component system cell cycle response regulator